MNWAPIIVAAVIAVVIVPAVMRLRDMAKIPVLIWPVLFVSAATPAFMAWQLLEPPPPAAEFTLEGPKGEASIEVPPGHSILVTGVMDELAEGTDAGKTDYALKIAGEGWYQNETGNVKRKTEGDGMHVDATGEKGLTSGDRKRASQWGEDVQSRFDLDGGGQVDIALTLWNGKAATALEVAVIKSPVGNLPLIGIFAVCTLAALVLEVRYRAEKLTGDVAFLTLYAIFLRYGTTPADAFQGVAGAVLPAFLLGEGAMAGIAWLSIRSANLKAKAEEAAANDS